MAIHDDYPGLTVRIICDSKPIEEHMYKEEEEEPNTTTQYIECQSHAEFAIETMFRPPFAPLDLDVAIYLDWVRVGGRPALKHQILNRIYTRSKTKWKEGGEWRASKFVFSDLNVVQEESEVLTEENLDALSQVGTISVVITPILSIQRKPESRGRKKELKEFGMISEETVKGNVRSHAIGLAPALAIKAPIQYSVKKAKDPLVTFRFKYRSIAALKSLGIIPRSPSPSQDIQPKLVKQENALEPSPEFCPGNALPTVNLQAETASVMPVLLQQNSLNNQSAQSSLTKKDILILIKHYRGSSDGLEGLPEKDLAILLSSYRGDKPDETPIKQEPVFSKRRVDIKRESVLDSVARGQGKKRKMEIIVLDD
ncbi:unnamed protein product [Alternaria alternata]